MAMKMGTSCENIAFLSPERNWLESLEVGGQWMLRVSVVAGCVCSPPSSDPYWDSPDKLCALRISWFLFPKLDSYFQKR